MTASNPPSAPVPQCEVCGVDLRVKYKGRYVTMYDCPKCGVVVYSPPKSPSAS
jgi:predicted RNA-binding Zn-ribbon protein involved in translation (DUF1610 family)